MKKIIPIITMMLMACFAHAQMDVIDAKSAVKLMKDKNVVMVSTRTPANYAKVHVTGAVHINHKDLYGDKSMLKSSADIAKLLGAKGISNTNKILLYDDGSSKYSGRMYWILKFMGANDVQIIDGGMKGWRMARGPVTKNPTTVVAKTFTPKVNKSLYASMTEVGKAVNGGSYMLVDCRSADEFNGVASTSLRPGRIPSAINFEYKNVLDERGLVKSTEELTKLLANAGITNNKTIILYCETSVRAGVLFTVLKGLNYPNVKVYDGAYLEWQSVDSNKVIL